MVMPLRGMGRTHDSIPGVAIRSTPGYSRGAATRQKSTPSTARVTPLTIRVDTFNRPR